VNRMTKATLTVCMATLVALASAAPSQAAFGISAFDGGVFDAGGGAYTQAGGHPDTASTTFTLNRSAIEVRGDDYLVPDGGDMRNAVVDLPAGLVGNPAAAQECSKELRIPTNKQARVPSFDASRFCPLSSIVGIASVTVFGDNLSAYFGQPLRFIAPVFNLEPPPGVAAQFGFGWSDQKAILDATVRNAGDYGVTVSVRNANEIKSVLGSSVTLWGTPADPSHDIQRCMAFYYDDPNFDPGAEFPGESGGPVPICADPDFSGRRQLLPSPASVPPRALVTNPTACTAPGVGLETRLRLEPWNPASAPDEATFVSHRPPGWPLPREQWGAAQGPDGCERVPFDPSFEASAGSRKADSPSSLAVDLSFPQDGLANPTGIATGHLKRATVTLPDGWSVSPSAADGLVGCSDAQSSVGTVLAAQCPEASKIGTVEATTPLLDETLTGGVYVGTQESDDPSSGRMFRLFIALNSEERGIRIKLPGQIRVDPASGRVETTFDNNPQAPVDKITLRLKAGPRAPLATPRDCGAKTVVADLESWSGARVTRTSDLTVDCPATGGFAPAFKAGPANLVGGAFSQFLVRIDRPDGQEFVDGVDVELPKGVLAKLKGVPVCSDAQANAGTCGAGSRVGSAVVGAGPGTSPFYLKGQPVYLAGRYKGAPYSLSVATRAKAGPFDLGTVVVRQALHVDPSDAHVTAKSDPVPTIVKGVPLRLRSINVDIDRPRFALNPSSCATKHATAMLHSQQGSTSTQTSRFGVHDCSLLTFKPRVGLRLTGKRQVRTGKHPGIRAQVKQSGIGEAAISRAKVILPKSLALDPANAQALCEFEDGTKPDLENHCPKGSIVGRARAVTPLLDEPLSGNVYFVKNVRRSASGNLIRTLPMIVVALRGKIAINLEGTSSTTRDGRLVNTFAGVPDAPITKFNLNIQGGSGGIIAVTRTRRARINLCAKPNGHTAEVATDGHNAKRADFRTRVKTPCARNPGRKAKRAHR
jgi:hypothetical protein